MSDIKLLTGCDYGRAVQKLLSTSSRVDAAVSYWSPTGLKGLNLLDKIGEQEPLSIRVICDLEHIACHWKPIEELMTRHVLVKKTRGLHAKVWIGTDQLILGSANCSNAALHLDDSSDQYLNDEAGLLIERSGEIAHTRKWFEQIWKKASLVSKSDIKEKKKRHPKVPLDRRINLSDNLRPFEDLVGDIASTDYRRKLRELGFTNVEGSRNMRLEFNDINDLDRISKDLIDAVIALIKEAEGVETVKSPQKPLPLEFKESEGEKNRALFRRMAAFVESGEFRNMWLETPGKRQDGKYSFSLRLKSTVPKKGHFAVLTIYPDKIETAGDRMFHVHSEM